MHVLLGYRWFPTAAGYHIERALQALGHTVTYIGLPCSQRAGYDTTVPVDEIVAALPGKPDLYLWVDPAGRYFPPGIERLSIPTACYLIDVHLGHWRKQAARFFDAVFIAQKDYLERFRRAVGHDQVYWLPLAAASDVHYDHHLPRIYDVGFVGNIARAHRKTARSQAPTDCRTLLHQQFLPRVYAGGSRRGLRSVPYYLQLQYRWRCDYTTL